MKAFYKIARVNPESMLLETKKFTHRNLAKARAKALEYAAKSDLTCRKQFSPGQTDIVEDFHTTVYFVDERGADHIIHHTSDLKGPDK